MNKLTILLIINPMAGMGGSIAAKGSDDLTYNQAFELGVQPRASSRSLRCLTHLKSLVDDDFSTLHFLTDSRYGAELLSESGFTFDVVQQWPEQTAHSDTCDLLKSAFKQTPDLIVFAGGDGTARNIVDVMESLQKNTPVIGLPTGVKMHSGCFAISPEAAAELLAQAANGKMLSLKSEEVRDIDEQALNNGQVKSRFYGELKVPDSLQYMQHTKLGGVEDEQLVQTDISDWFSQQLQNEIYYFLGAGTTVNAIKKNLINAHTNSEDINSTLLGVDVFVNGKCVATDCSESDLLEFAGKGKFELIISPTGGQGYLFGRGNQQFSPSILKHSNMQHIHVVSSKSKLNRLNSRPLLIDTNDLELDKQLSGLLQITTGWDDQVLYPSAASYE